MIETQVDQNRAKRINPGGGPVPGIGGLSLVAFSVLVAMVSPRLWLVAACVSLAGSAFGVALYLTRRHEGLHSTRH